MEIESPINNTRGSRGSSLTGAKAGLVWAGAWMQVVAATKATRTPRRCGFMLSRNGGTDVGRGGSAKRRPISQHCPIFLRKTTSRGSGCVGEAAAAFLVNRLSHPSSDHGLRITRARYLLA